MPTAYSVLSGDVLARWAAGVLSADTDAAACGRVVYTMPSRWEGYWRTLATLVCAMGGTMVCVDTATWRVFGSRDMLSALDVVCDSAISGADAARRAAQDDPLWVADWVGSIATACSNIFSIACCGHRVDFNLVMLKRSKISFDLAMSCYPDSKPVRVRDPRSGGSHALVRVLSCPQTHWCQGMSL
jgi:hypothetical protein